MSLPASRTARPDNPQRRLLNSYELRLMCQDLVQRQGCDLEAILRGSGVTARQLENPAHRLTLEQELTIYTRVAGYNRWVCTPGCACHYPTTTCWDTP